MGGRKTPLVELKITKLSLHVFYDMDSISKISKVSFNQSQGFSGTRLSLVCFGMLDV